MLWGSRIIYALTHIPFYSIFTLIMLLGIIILCSW